MGWFFILVKIRTKQKKEKNGFQRFRQDCRDATRFYLGSDPIAMVRLWFFSLPRHPRCQAQFFVLPFRGNAAKGPTQQKREKEPLSGRQRDPEASPRNTRSPITCPESMAASLNSFFTPGCLGRELSPQIPFAVKLNQLSESKKGKEIEGAHSASWGIPPSGPSQPCEQLTESATSGFHS